MPSCKLLDKSQRQLPLGQVLYDIDLFYNLSRQSYVYGLEWKNTSISNIHCNWHALSSKAMLPTPGDDINFRNHANDTLLHLLIAFVLNDSNASV